MIVNENNEDNVNDVIDTIGSAVIDIMIDRDSTDRCDAGEAFDDDDDDQTIIAVADLDEAQQSSGNKQTEETTICVGFWRVAFIIDGEDSKVVID